jgi:hypothetical protein
LKVLQSIERGRARDEQDAADEADAQAAEKADRAGQERHRVHLRDASQTPSASRTTRPAAYVAKMA